MAQLVARLVRNEKVGGSNPPSSTTGRHPIRMSVFCMFGRVGAVPAVVSLVAPRVFRAPRGALVGRAALCARGRRPARETSAPRASFGALSRSPARPRHRPRAPQPGPLVPPAPLHTGGPCGAVLQMCQARPRRRPQAPQPGPPVPPVPSTPVAPGRCLYLSSGC